MGLRASRVFVFVAEKATNHKSTSEDWALIMEICDKVGNSPQHARDCLRSIVKRLNATDPHIVILAITVSNDCDLLFIRPFDSVLIGVNVASETVTIV